LNKTNWWRSYTKIEQ